MIKYQLIFIVKPSKDSKVQAKKLEELIIEHKGKIKSQEFLGNKPLAYPINKQSEGDYYQIIFQLDAKKVTQFKKEIFQKELVLRFLLLNNEGK